MGPGWLGVVGRSRFADVARLAEPTSLWVRTPAPFISSAGPKAATGDRTAALTAYGQALRLSRAAGDRGNEAATLNNIGAVYRGRGEPQRALEYFGRALPIRREVGDRTGEVVTRYNVAMIHHAQGSSTEQSPSWSRSSSWTARLATRLAVRHRDAPPRTPGAGELGPGRRSR
jgi:tetratricopeptide (TPR) repeat protein